MFGIGRKKRKEEEEPKEEAKIKKPGRKSKPKKKEQEKSPWGKRERYLLVFFLLATVLSSGGLALYARSWKLPGLPRFKIPSDPFKETFVIEKNTDDQEIDLSKKAKRIVTGFDEASLDLSGVYGFEVINLETGERFGKNENEVFQAASLIKLPLMTYIFEQAQKKRINLSTKHSLREEEKIGGSGVLQYEQAGKVITNRELIEYMGKYSDNTAFNIGIEMVGEDKFQNYIQEIGMRNTSYSTNMTTVRDISNFFKKLWDGRLISQDNRDELLDYLTDTSYEQHLPSGVPENVAVSHKYGREVHVVNDAGIVFSESPYIVVIMSKGVVESEADEAFPSLSKIIYQGMAN